MEGRGVSVGYRLLTDILSLWENGGPPCLTHYVKDEVSRDTLVSERMEEDGQEKTGDSQEGAIWCTHSQWSVRKELP